MTENCGHKDRRGPNCNTSVLCFTYEKSLCLKVGESFRRKLNNFLLNFKLMADTFIHLFALSTTLISLRFVLHLSDNVFRASFYIYLHVPRYQNSK